MDREKLVRLRELIDEILPDGHAPSPDELDWDDDAIALYDALESVAECLENCGY